MENRIETPYDQLGIGQRLLNVCIVQVNDEWDCLDLDRLAIIDGGIELTFEQDRFVIAWNATKELYDISVGSIEQSKIEVAYRVLDLDELRIGQALIGRKLIQKSMVWVWYYDLDDHGNDTRNISYAPLECLMTFEGDQTLQIAAVSTTLDGASIRTIAYDSECGLILNEGLKIEIVDDGLLHSNAGGYG